MTSLPPKIDQRTYEDIVEQAKELAQNIQFGNQQIMRRKMHERH
jgi:hypothetical protein